MCRQTSRLSQYHKYLLQSPACYLVSFGSSHPASYPKLLQFMGFPSSASCSLVTLIFLLCILLPLPLGLLCTLCLPLHPLDVPVHAQSVAFSPLDPSDASGHTHSHIYN